MPKTAILIPYRQGDAWREKAWGFVRCWYENLGEVMDESVELFAMDGDVEGPFNRSRAINAGARAAVRTLDDAPTRSSRTDVYLIADADTFVNLDQVALAIETARNTGRLVHGYSSWHGLSSHGSQHVYKGGEIGKGWTRNDWRRMAPETYWESLSSCLAVPRALFEAVGGFDERFQGWGYEDRAFFYACRTIGGLTLRVPGPAYHLWHQPAPERQAAIGPRSANRMLGIRYEEANGNPAAMAELLKERT